MKIRRSRPTKDFLQVPNATVRDDRLSHMARGILVELLSRPDGWEITCDEMWQASVAKHGKASPGRRVFRAAFAELKEYGYLTSERTLLASGQHGTVLAITDVPAGHTDVPHGGTSVPPAKTDVSTAQTDVPHAGTSEPPTDVPYAGTSERPAETPETPARADVPHGGTPDSPAETPRRAGRSDVPHAGTSKEEDGVTNTGTNTPASAPPDTSDAAAARYPAELTQLMDAMSLAGINLPWKFVGDDMIRVINDIRRLGTPLMVGDAVEAKARATEPPFSSRFFYDRWHSIRTPAQPGPNQNGRPALRAVSGGWTAPNRPHPMTGAAAPTPTTDDYKNAKPF